LAFAAVKTVPDIAKINATMQTLNFFISRKVNG
jgi:hypothetical protein